MSNYTPEEFMEKADYEGGPLSAIFGYGLRETDLDIQSGEFYDAVKELSGMAERIEQLKSIMYKYE